MDSFGFAKLATPRAGKGLPRKEFSVVASFVRRPGSAVAPAYGSTSKGGGFGTWHGTASPNAERTRPDAGRSSGRRGDHRYRPRRPDDGRPGLELRRP